MSIFAIERPSDSPFVERIMQGYSSSEGIAVRPAELNWHLVFVKVEGKRHQFLVGPWTFADNLAYGAGAEILWIKFKLGTFFPHLPTKNFLDSEQSLPDAVNQSFWLHSDSWQIPDFENADDFVANLVRDGLLVQDSLVTSSLEGHDLHVSPRTLRHRFLQSTGMSQKHIQQVARAQEAAKRLQLGRSILDTCYDLNYFDQAHFSKSLKRYIGYSPSQILANG